MSINMEITTWDSIVVGCSEDTARRMAKQVLGYGKMKEKCTCKNHAISILATSYTDCYNCFTAY